MFRYRALVHVQRMRKQKNKKSHAYNDAAPSPGEKPWGSPRMRLGAFFERRQVLRTRYLKLYIFDAMDLPLDLLMLEGVLIDREAQIRELERYQRARADRLLAQELQHPDTASVSSEDDMVERDCVTSSRNPAPTESTTSESGGLGGVPQLDVDRDLQLALMMSREVHSSPLLPSPPSQVDLELLADQSPNPKLTSAPPDRSGLLPPPTLDVFSSSSDNVVEAEEDFSTAPNSPTSRSPWPAPRGAGGGAKLVHTWGAPPRAPPPP